METKYPVSDIYNCIQGEGCMAGTAMVLVRLQGCQLCCFWCDTKYTWKLLPENERQTAIEAFGENPHYKWMTGEEIGDYLAKDHVDENGWLMGPKWVLLTGGEPFLYQLDDLIDNLHDMDYRVAVETSGFEDDCGIGLRSLDWICISPKLFALIQDQEDLKKRILEEADELKFVVTHESEIEQILDFLDFYKWYDAEVCLQPVSNDPEMTKVCYDAVIKNGWRLSLQIHKFLGVK